MFIFNGNNRLRVFEKDDTIQKIVDGQAFIFGNLNFLQKSEPTPPPIVTDNIYLTDDKKGLVVTKSYPIKTTTFNPETGTQTTTTSYLSNDLTINDITDSSYSEDVYYYNINLSKQQNTNNTPLDPITPEQTTVHDNGNVINMLADCALNTFHNYKSGAYNFISLMNFNSSNSGSAITAYNREIDLTKYKNQNMNCYMSFKLYQTSKSAQEEVGTISFGLYDSSDNVLGIITISIKNNISVSGSCNFTVPSDGIIKLKNPTPTHTTFTSTAVRLISGYLRFYQTIYLYDTPFYLNINRSSFDGGTTYQLNINASQQNQNADYTLAINENNEGTLIKI